jgi:hypothetical protein
MVHGSAFKVNFRKLLKDRLEELVACTSLLLLVRITRENP